MKNNWRQKLLWRIPMEIGSEDEKKFVIILIESIKSGIDYAMNGYYGYEEAKRILDIYAPDLSARKDQYLTLQDNIEDELKNFYEKYGINYEDILDEDDEI